MTPERKLNKEIEHHEKQLSRLIAIRDKNLPRTLPERTIINQDLLDVIEEAMVYYYSEDYSEDNDYDVYIYEAALKWAYGPNIFDKLNKEVFI